MDVRIDDLLSKADNKFMLVNAISARAKQVSEGSLPYIEDFDPNNAILTAIREIGSGRLVIKCLAPIIDGKLPERRAPRMETDDVSIFERLEKGAKKKTAAPAKKK